VPRALALLAAAGCLLLLAAAPAAAHASLLEMSPGPEEQLAEPPTEIRLTFSEAVTPTDDSVRLFDPAAEELDVAEVRAEGEVLTASVPELEVDGSYTVAWKVVSADGHQVSGAYLFHLRSATLTEPVDAADVGGSPLADVLRALGAVLAVGGLVACVGGVLVERAGPMPRWWGLHWVVITAGTALLLAGALVAVGSSLSGSLDVVLSTTSGRGAVVALLLSVAGLVASALAVTERLELLLAAGVGVTVALQGHAVAVAPVALSATATLLHVLAAVVWGVGLFRLEHLSRVEPGRLVHEVRRFSPVGVGCVVALAVTGVALVVDRVGLDELTGTAYGRLGIAKVASLVVAVVLAWRNRSAALGAEAAAGDGGDTGDGDAASAPDAEGAARTATLVHDDTVAAVRTGVRAEMVVLAVALALGAVLAQVPPPSVAGDVGGGYFIERVEYGDGQAEITFDPATRGMNEVHVTAIDDAGRLMPSVGELQLSLELPDEDVGPIEADMQVITLGHSMTFVRVPFEGTWRVRIHSQPDPFTELEAFVDVPIGRG